MEDRFIKGMAEILEVESLTKESRFDEIGADWDSLAIVSTIALLDECFEIMIPGAKLAEVSSIDEILSIVNQNIETI